MASGEGSAAGEGVAEVRERMVRAARRVSFMVKEKKTGLLVVSLLVLGCCIRESGLGEESRKEGKGARGYVDL